MYDRTRLLPLPPLILLATAVCFACGRHDSHESSSTTGPNEPPSAVDDGLPPDHISPPGQQASPPEDGAKPEPISIDDVPWPVRPGVRIAALRARVPTIDRVVLVPDEATYLEALGEWSLAGRWPILIEDDTYAPMFIRRFKPAEVIRKPAASAKLPSGAALEERLTRAVADAWRQPSQLDDPALPAATMKDRFDRAGWTPPGVVITSVKDEAWPAAVALAADRGEPITFLDGYFGPPNGSLSVEDWNRFSTEVESRVKSTGYPYDQLGDAIDTITLVRKAAVKYISPEDPSGKSRTAVTDGLARINGGTRWGFAGWIFGPAPRATYMAMSAIFLQPQSALLFDTYPDTPGWSAYAMDEPSASLAQVGMTVRHVDAPASTATAWENLAPSGVDEDLILVNTKGNQNWFSAADDKRVYVHDVPILNVPAAVHFIHSWSCIAPENRDTLAGRWLERGAYVYVGSVHEPTLTAFVPPKLLVERLRSTVPFLIAARIWETRPWRVATIGDPLMTVLQPVPRKPPEALPIDGQSLRDLLKEQKPAADKSGDWSQALTTINLLGLDDVAVALYEQRLKDQASSQTIAQALGPLFRRGDDRTFMHAAEQIPISQMTPVERDMLWLKWLPTLRMLSDPEQITLMRSLIRTPLGFVDACRLAPLMRAHGQRDLVDPMLDEHEEDVNDGYARQMVRGQRR